MHTYTYLMKNDKPLQNLTPFCDLTIVCNLNVCNIVICSFTLYYANNVTIYNTSSFSWLSLINLNVGRYLLDTQIYV